MSMMPVCVCRTPIFYIYWTIKKKKHFHYTALQLMNNLGFFFAIFFVYWTVDGIEADRKHGGWAGH